MAGPIPIRRFRCSRCGRTFSWRPPFLAFGRRLAAVVYQRAFKAWALGRRRGSRQDSASWHELGLAGRKSFFQHLTRRLDELLSRLEGELARRTAPPCGAVTPHVPRQLGRQRLWHLSRRLARMLVDPTMEPRLACHLVFMSLALHPDGVCYSLKST